MLKIRRSKDRGLASHGWLLSKHSFSFAEYHDADHMRFGPLRVINEDKIQGGTGFGSHPHHDMEIVSYVIAGALSHEDSMGNKTVIRPGEVQRMSAGTGVVHSEKNEDKDQVAHFLQIWLIPDQKSVKPSYGQKSFSAAFEENPLVLVLSKQGRNDSIVINQDADVYVSKRSTESSIQFPIRPKRGLWLQVVKGSVVVLGQELSDGDGASVVDVEALAILSSAGSEFFLFDLPIGQ